MASKKPKRAVSKKAAAETVLVLRTCDSRLQGHGGFQWPESGPVSCSDWNPKPVCGAGLHGLLWGCGNGHLLSWEPDAKWLVVEVEAASIVELDGGEKVKFPAGTVLFAGDRKTATEMIAARKPGAIVGITAMAGDCGTAMAGDCGTAMAGTRGTAMAGAHGTAMAGDCGTATAGEYGTAMAGYCGILNIRWWDGERRRIATVYVGENGIEPNVPYKLDDKGKPVKVMKLEKSNGK